MKINKIKINSYGKLKNKEIELNNNINIIYGENESGKSTLLKFILNIFYGISKNKKGKEISDFEKYKPWNSEEFSGKLLYELDNKNKYEIYREFNKRNPIIFNENGEDISKEFNIDKNKGSEFFYEQTGINEEMFTATSVAMQKEIKIGKETQSVLIQKISNLLGTGEDNISYNKALEKLKKRQLEKIGTERSKEKPLNIIQNKIEKNTQKINELKKYENIQYEIEQEKNELKNQIKKDEIKNELIKEIKKIKEKENLEKEKIKIKENINEKNKNKINILKNKIEEKEDELNKKIKEKNNPKNKKEKNKMQIKLNIIFILLILINILWIIFMPQIINNKIVKYSILITIPIFLIIYKIIKNKSDKKIKEIEKNKNKEIEKINDEKINYEKEIKIIEKNYQEIINDINKINMENNLLNNLEQQKTINKYKIIDENEIKKLFLIDIEEKNNYIENKINNDRLELNKLELEFNNIEPQLDNLSNIEEELESLEEQYKDLQDETLSINIAREMLEKAYEKMKNNVSPIFTEKLSKNISKITNDKYNNIYLNDEKGLIVELENGNYISAERLSIGTIDQLYLSLRLSMLDEISEEKVPIILDEAFAYYDKKRLENILKYLANEFSDRQVIILTCTKREKAVLEENQINFNFIEL